MATMNCPHCKKSMSELTLEPCGAAINYDSKFKAVAFLCPNCRSVLGSQIDPRAIKTETVAEIDALLKEYLAKRAIASPSDVEMLLRRYLSK
jgi:transposase-like protein